MSKLFKILFVWGIFFLSILIMYASSPIDDSLSRIDAKLFAILILASIIGTFVILFGKKEDDSSSKSQTSNTTQNFKSKKSKPTNEPTSISKSKSIKKIEPEKIKEKYKTPKSTSHARSITKDVNDFNTTVKVHNKEAGLRDRNRNKNT